MLFHSEPLFTTPNAVVNVREAKVAIVSLVVRTRKKGGNSFLRHAEAYYINVEVVAGSAVQRLNLSQLQNICAHVQWYELGMISVRGEESLPRAQCHLNRKKRYPGRFGLLS